MSRPNFVENLLGGSFKGRRITQVDRAHGAHEVTYTLHTSGGRFTLTEAQVMALALHSESPHAPTFTTSAEVEQPPGMVIEGIKRAQAAMDAVGHAAIHTGGEMKKLNDALRDLAGYTQPRPWWVIADDAREARAIMDLYDINPAACEVVPVIEARARIARGEGYGAMLTRLTPPTYSEVRTALVHPT